MSGFGFGFGFSPLGALLNPFGYKEFIERVLTDSGTLLLGSDGKDTYLLNKLRDFNRKSLLKNASLLMIPSAVKVSKLYSVLPIDGSGDFAFTRSTKKWAKDNTSAYAEKAINLPALSWDGEKYTFSSEATAYNYFTSPSAPVTKTITVPNGGVYGVSVKGTGSIELSGAATGVITESTPAIKTMSGTSLTITVTGTLTNVQVESIPSITSPIYGTGGPIQRNRDAAQLTSVSALIGQTEGTLFVEFDYTQIYPTELANVMRIWTDASNYINCYRTAYADRITITCNVYVSGTLQAQLISGNFPVAPGGLKIAIGYKANDFVLYINGVNQAVDTAGTVPACSKIDLGNSNAGGQLNEGIISFALYKTKLTDGQLESLTNIDVDVEDLVAETTAIIDRMDSEPSNNLKNFINEAITDLKSSGIWDKLDKLVLSNLHTWKSSLLDLKGGRGMFPRAAWTAKTGYAYGGDKGYIDTLFRPTGNENAYTSEEDNNYSTDDAMVAIYSQTNIVPGAGVTGNLLTTIIESGDDPVGPVTILRLKNTTMEYCLNQPESEISSLDHGGTVSGLTVMERGADDSLDLWRNGVKTSVAGNTADACPENELRLLNPSASGNTISMFAAGKSLGSLNAEFYRIINRFMIQVSSGLPSDLLTGRYQTTQPMLTIRMDDGYAGQYGGWKTLFDSYDVKPAWAILTDVIDGLAEGYPNHATWTDVENAYANGWEITLHGEQDVPLNSVPIEEMQIQILSGKAKIESHGIEVLHYNTHSYTQSSMYVREFGARHFKTVSGGWGFALPSETNPNILDPYNLRGMAADIGTLNGSPAYSLVTPEGIALLKAQLDVAAANNRWAIIIVHEYSEVKAAGMAEIIDYAQSLNINFVTHEQAIQSCTLI